MCFFFNDMIRFWDILLDKKLYKEKQENILIYETSQKMSKGAKPLRIRFNEIYGFIKIYYKIRYIASII